MKYSELLEKIAMKIYYYSSGLSPDEYEEVMGCSKKHWDNGLQPWKEEDCLEEHERDDYRVQAEEVLKLLLREDLIWIRKSEEEKDA